MARTGSFFGPGGIRLVLTTQDPDTPSMVYLKGRSATFDCALDEGVDGEELTQAQYGRLEGFQADSDAAYNEARRGMKEYE